jgi:PAS domain S-box-containing protein
MSNGNIERLQQILHRYENAEEQLILSNAYLASIFENADEAIIAKELDRTITAWNPAAERLYGYSPVEATGRPISIIVPESKKQELEQIMTTLARGERVSSFETIRKKKDGTEISVILTVSPIVDRAGNIIGASSIAHPKGGWTTVSEDG